MDFFKPCAGPLANDVHALDTLCSSVVSARPALYDSTALDVPWMDLSGSPIPEKLRIGVVSEDPSFPLHPPVKRAMAEAVRLLEAQGHYIHKISAPSAHVADALAVAFAYFFLDDTPPKYIAASGEPVVPSVKQSMEAFHAFKNSFLDDMAHLEGVKRVAALNVKRKIIADEWRSLWKEQKLDVVIGPSAQHTAVPHDTYGLPPYTLFLNVLDVSAREALRSCLTTRKTYADNRDSTPHASYHSASHLANLILSLLSWALVSAVRIVRLSFFYYHETRVLCAIQANNHFQTSPNAWTAYQHRYKSLLTRCAMRSVLNLQQSSMES